MSTNVGAVDFELLLNSNPFNKGLKDTTNTIKSSGIEISLKKIGKLAVAAFSVKAIVNFGKECIDLGSDLTEVQNVVDVTFGSLNTEVNNFAENAITQFGLGQTVTKKYVGTFGAMAKAFNFSNKEALAMSETLTGLTGDIASFYNLSSDEAYTKLKELSGYLANAEITSHVTAKNGEKTETYEVTENFTMKWSSQRIYMMDYERTMTELFTGDSDLFSGKRIILGIGDGDGVHAVKSTGGQYTAFVTSFPNISIHVPAWGTTINPTYEGLGKDISIHVPAWGTTALGNEFYSADYSFQSTFPRGERLYRQRNSNRIMDFNPRSRVGNDVTLRYS